MLRIFIIIIYIIFYDLLQFLEFYDYYLFIFIIINSWRTTSFIAIYFIFLFFWFTSIFTLHEWLPSMALTIWYYSYELILLRYLSFSSFDYRIIYLIPYLYSSPSRHPLFTVSSIHRRCIIIYPIFIPTVSIEKLFNFAWIID